jgi:hypothetical protein
VRGEAAALPWALVHLLTQQGLSMRISRISRISAALLVSLFALPLAIAACGDSNQGDADPFDTLQACFDEHNKEESLPVQMAIVVCCVDHPIAGVHPSCKDSQADCVTHVRTELDSSVTDTDITAACTDYIKKKGQ